ncbi:glycoprotein 3-alpha-L-fucosyltransferase A-like isoform X1 [Hyposmocoma kahamanoa]|uniref:glycoprotein 3-alpha-L-fucosyltransferase A-like isoform X1 n=1 Tax=Hyposmocoma kahamanoa TaxID=1477025 RepID=UPI000E6D7AC1|nr:glycoprotein 3-alpha-L-fucosyltransferase A-like isoform X1 [Hyposmocoma kahamanoa]XP_026332092.1 glycoprotein 3-alpha-L-fucosyltransferase A-like isoform X1 [Hyposmocoma kahamanoa]XP_026332093.1 glycoprotein 3-alpha-L-fucosyltransferase A-like isoform X1 [Hyposmocoma kahamanoa]XP_026332094.1 glycoprotein 3-alpha-L-fucosyltransferase A-like isoform X1 [Hyposmocoma kahamanoa]
MCMQWTACCALLSLQLLSLLEARATLHSTLNSRNSYLVDEVAQRPWFMQGGKRRPVVDSDSLSVMWLFPEDALGDALGEDRIIDQLMYTISSDVLLNKTILLANEYSTWNVHSGQTEFVQNKCPVDRCILTMNSDESGTADAILFNEYHTTLNARRPPNQIWILYYLESIYAVQFCQTSPLQVFNWTASYRRDSDIVTPYERWVYYNPKITQKELDRNYAANKTRKVAWFVSNCHTRNRRYEYALQLARHISVDIYGWCGPNKYGCLRNDPNCWKMLNEHYKFYLAFENTNSKDYITEKFFVNGLQHDVLPVVMGARQADYAAVAPHNSYVHVDEFAGPKELAAYLHRLDKDDSLYNSYFKWKGTGEFINTYFFCRLCAMLHANDQRQRKPRFIDEQVWWDEANGLGSEARRTPPPPRPLKSEIVSAFFK